MPHQVGDLIVGDRPVMRNAGDPSQRIVDAAACGIHLADDRVLCAGDGGQRRHRGADTVAAMVGPHRLQRPGWIRQSQFRCVGEQFDHIIESPVIDGRCI
jgi:hypothetical protein